MAIKIFTIDKQGNLAINREEILLYDSFATILKRDKGSPGDTQARKKKQAYKEFKYIYFISDVLSQPNRKGYDKKEAHMHAINNSNLSFDWKPDEVVDDAIRMYKEEQSDISVEIVMELLKTFRLSKKVISKVRKNIENKLLSTDLSNDSATELLGLINTSIKYGRDIPKLTKELNKALSEVQNTIENNELLRGSKVPVPDSAQPGKDY